MKIYATGDNNHDTEEKTNARPLNPDIFKARDGDGVGEVVRCARAGSLARNVCTCQDANQNPVGITRSKHMKVQKNAAYLLGRRHTVCKFSGNSPLSSYKTTLKHQLNG